MRHVKDVLRLKLTAGLSRLHIAASLRLLKGVVTKCVGPAAAAGLDWAAVRDADETALEQRPPVAPGRPRGHVQPGYGRLCQALHCKGMTLMLLSQKHQADYAGCQTYGYTRFCENYRRFAKSARPARRCIDASSLPPRFRKGLSSQIASAPKIPGQVS